MEKNSFVSHFSFFISIKKLVLLLNSRSYRSKEFWTNAMKKEATASEDIQDAANALMNHLDKKRKKLFVTT